MMFTFDEDAINIAINNISGYIVYLVAKETGKPIEEVSEAFFASDTYSLLSDIETGYYWDSISELTDKFSAEIKAF